MAEAEGSYHFFWKNGSPFSQWHPSGFKGVCPYEEGGTERYFDNAEQWMMFCKAHLMGDVRTGEQIMRTSVPAAIKKLGRQIAPWDDAKWNEHKYDIVVQGNRLKFAQNDDIRAVLLATAGSELVEASPYDRVWGIGLAADDPRAQVKAQWEGENLLGMALTQVRDEIISTSG